MDFEVDKRTDVYAEQRGREQVIYKKNKAPLDKIKPISDKTKKQEYLDAAKKIED